ncbi:hypothetical protein [Amycolatopsis thailandensis]|nr:hypothetical protein [Amycolatopsis thailandensis]
MRGACGTSRECHGDACDPAALKRVAALEERLDRELGYLIAAVSAA